MKKEQSSPVAGMNLGALPLPELSPDEDMLDLDVAQGNPPIFRSTYK